MLLLLIGTLLKMILTQILEAFYLFSDARVEVKPYITARLDLIFHTEGFFLILVFLISLHSH